jgi:HSP20 family molecular chaperone IbpA
MFNLYTWPTHSSLSDEVTVEKDGSYKLTLEVPGFSREDVKLTVKENALNIELKRENKQRKATYRLGKNIDQDNIKATCKDGLLTVHCPTRQPEVKTINVNVD